MSKNIYVEIRKPLLFVRNIFMDLCFFPISNISGFALNLPFMDILNIYIPILRVFSNISSIATKKVYLPYISSKFSVVSFSRKLRFRVYLEFVYISREKETFSCTFQATVNHHKYHNLICCLLRSFLKRMEF